MTSIQIIKRNSIFKKVYISPSIKLEPGRLLSRVGNVPTVFQVKNKSTHSHWFQQCMFDFSYAIQRMIRAFLYTHKVALCSLRETNRLNTFTD